VVDETLAAINYNLGNVIFPATEEECKAAADGFQSLRGCPWYGVVTAFGRYRRGHPLPEVVVLPGSAEILQPQGFLCFADSGMSVVQLQDHLRICQARRVHARLDSIYVHAIAHII
jgi:hypothetical protein